jgi:hypothetical protein
MASSTLTLPVDALSALPAASRTSFSKSRPGSGVEHSVSPSHRHPYDQEAIEMNRLGDKTPSISTPGALEVPAWNMSAKQEWTAIAACCWCLFLVSTVLGLEKTNNLSIH